MSPATTNADRSAITKHWDVGDIPDQHGRHVVVTGASGGLGEATAAELARRGARVVMACRDTGKGATAAAAIRAGAPGAELDVRPLDLADLGSVRAFADAFERDYGRLDLLINNAGVMAPPRRETADGFELQLGTNHLGHFALTGLLLPALLRAGQPRVVTVSSILHLYGRINLDDPHRRRRYRRYGAYGQSKLANLLFSFELARRAEAAGTALLSVAAHPGYAATNLQVAGLRPGPLRSGIAAVTRLFATSARTGALPTLCAATVPNLPGASYLGPGKLLQLRGHPTIVRAGARAYDQPTARRLWEASESWTGVRFDFAATPAGDLNS
ncbi:oxidoreductase [Rugosimonospora acidiphila]|uniref:Oxidoreductase n=1 Tax=Rugosimonospora acidiphila TaxID=556531 RepID=A0ABP9RSJ0_9ACTN